MSDEKDDGGFAFPHPWNADMGWSPRDAPGGMSLRDYFAAAALTGLIMSKETDDLLSDAIAACAMALMLCILGPPLALALAAAIAFRD